MEPLSVLCSVVILLLAVHMDLQSSRISNRLILAGYLAGFLLFFSPACSPEWYELLPGILLPVAIGWLPFRMRALGAGDIKLFSVIGCLNGGEDALYCIAFSFLCGAGISLIRLIRRRELTDSLVRCFQYFREVFMLKKLIPYEDGCREGHQIHFSAAILLGYLTLLGVKGCRDFGLF